MTTTITNYIINEFHDGDASLSIAPEDDLLSGGLLGSMDMMRLITFLEEEYNFKVQPQDMTIENFITVAAMTDYVSRATQA